MGLILTDECLKRTEDHLRRLRSRIARARKRLSLGKDRIPHDEINKVFDSYEVLARGLEESVVFYRSIRNGNLPKVHRNNLPLLVVFCRIASGMTQAEFAKMRGITTKRVAYYERNEYYGKSKTQIVQLVNSLGYRLVLLDSTWCTAMKV